MNDQFNILIVEDNEETFNILKTGLAVSPYKVFRANTAKEALRLSKEIYFMAVITENRLVDMSGTELIKRMKKIDYRSSTIVLTTYSFIDSAIETLKVGAYAYLLKPLKIEEVKLVLKRAIENRTLLVLAGERKYYQDMSILDGLTGVYNNRHFHEMLEWQIDHLRRFPQSFSLAMMDIDDFKKYNDTHGHLAGDRLLHNTAQLFLTSARGSDMVFRYGGEEFAVIMPQTRQENAKRAGERLVGVVTTHLPVTISVGLAAFPDDAQTKDDLINNADKALYRAKALGKNRVCVYPESLDK